MYIHELPEWPAFTREDDRLIAPLARVRQLHGRLQGKLDALGFPSMTETTLENLSQDVLRSTEIEGVRLDARQVRSSVAHRLGLEIPDSVAASREVDGMVDLTLDAIRNCRKKLTRKRLMDWQAALFPTGYSGLYKIRTGRWRDDSHGPMQLVGGGMGRERVFFQAPDAVRVADEMRQFLTWLERKDDDDPFLKAATAHVWFLTVHPFEDGNGRVARAITDLLLARMEGGAVRFYSLSSGILAERAAYYRVLEFTQKGTLDLTDWLLWFLGCLERSLERAATTIDKILQRHLFWQRHAAVQFNERHRKLLGRLMEGFEGKLTSGKWAKIAGCSPDTALRDIQFLLERGILEKDGAGGRSTGYRLA